MAMMASTCADTAVDLLRRFRQGIASSALNHQLDVDTRTVVMPLLREALQNWIDVEEELEATKAGENKDRGYYVAIALDLLETADLMIESTDDMNFRKNPSNSAADNDSRKEIVILMVRGARVIFRKGDGWDTVNMGALQETPSSSKKLDDTQFNIVINRISELALKILCYALGASKYDSALDMKPSCWWPAVMGCVSMLHHCCCHLSRSAPSDACAGPCGLGIIQSLYECSEHIVAYLRGLQHCGRPSIIADCEIEFHRLSLAVPRYLLTLMNVANSAYDVTAAICQRRDPNHKSVVNMLCAIVGLSHHLLSSSESEGVQKYSLVEEDGSDEEEENECVQEDLPSARTAVPFLDPGCTPNTSGVREQRVSARVFLSTDDENVDKEGESSQPHTSKASYSPFLQELLHFSLAALHSATADLAACRHIHETEMICKTRPSEEKPRPNELDIAVPERHYWDPSFPAEVADEQKIGAMCSHHGKGHAKSTGFTGIVLSVLVDSTTQNEGMLVRETLGMLQNLARDRGCCHYLQSYHYNIKSYRLPFSSSPMLSAFDVLLLVFTRICDVRSSGGYDMLKNGSVSGDTQDSSVILLQAQVIGVLLNMYDGAQSTRPLLKQMLSDAVTLSALQSIL